MMSRMDVLNGQRTVQIGMSELWVYLGIENDDNKDWMQTNSDRE